MRPEMIIARARYDICRSNRCGKFSRDFCSLFKGGCGCHLNPNRGAAVPAKTKMMGQKCPDGHWPVMTQADINAVLTDVAGDL